MHLLQGVSDLAKKNDDKSDDLIQVLAAESEQLEKNVIAEIRDYLAKRDDRIKEYTEQIEEMNRIIKEKDTKIEQLKTIISEALSKI